MSKGTLFDKDEQYYLQNGYVGNAALYEEVWPMKVCVKKWGTYQTNSTGPGHGYRNTERRPHRGHLK